MVVDPAITRAKFDREIEALLQRRAEEQRRGWFIMDTTFPKVFVVFASPILRPTPLLFGVDLDFTDYDLMPPSVRLVNPFTREPHTNQTWPREVGFWRFDSATQQLAPNLLQFPGGPEDTPFLCFPGVREYHDHPAHSGDKWLLHRSNKEGTLYVLLQKIYEAAVAPLTSYTWGIHVQGMQIDRNKIPQ